MNASKFSVSQNTLITLALALLVAVTGITCLVTCRKSSPAKSSILSTPRPTPSPKKNGVLVILDPGHGCIDPGCMVKSPNGLVVEHEYVYDICCRAKGFLEARGFTVVFTLEDKKTKFQERPEAFLPQDRNEIFISSPSTPIMSNEVCMRLRIKRGQQAVQKFSPSVVYWISVHFDALGTGELEGVSLLTPIEGNFTKAMTAAFDKKGMLRKKNEQTYHPVAINKEHRNVFILRDNVNPFSRRLLIELGNILNPRDQAKLLDPKWRNAWAETMTEGLQNAIAPPSTPSLSPKR